MEICSVVFLWNPTDRPANTGGGISSFAKTEVRKQKTSIREGSQFSQKCLTQFKTQIMISSVLFWVETFNLSVFLFDSSHAIKHLSRYDVTISQTADTLFCKGKCTYRHVLWFTNQLLHSGVWQPREPSRREASPAARGDRFQVTFLASWNCP